MKARKLTDSRNLVGVILPDGSIILKTLTPWNIDNSYPCHVIGHAVSLTTGDLNYWIQQDGAVPIYEGDRVELQF